MILVYSNHLRTVKLTNHMMNTFLIYLDIHNILYSLVLVYQVYFAFLRENNEIRGA